MTLDALLEGFEAGKHPRDRKGRWSTVMKAAGDLRHGDEVVHKNGTVGAVHGSPVDFGGGTVGIYFHSGPAITRRSTERVEVIKRSGTVAPANDAANARAHRRRGRAGLPDARPSTLYPGLMASMLEGFAAAEPMDPFAAHDFTMGDTVRVSVGGGASSVIGKVIRPHGEPVSHAVIAPDGGGAHVLAQVGQVKLNTPAQHAAAEKRAERQEQKRMQDEATAKWMATKPPGVKAPAAGKPVRESVLDSLLEFNVAEPRDPGGRWRSFFTGAGDRLVDPNELVATRTDPADKLTRGAQHMANAALGKGSKRAPISVRQVGGKLHIVDGHTTVHNAKQLGLTHVPVTIQQHGGFKVGDVVSHETGSRGPGGHGPVTFTKQPGLSTVVGLQRNGNLRLKHPETGTTHDVHHSHATKISALHPDYRGKVAQDAIKAQRGQLAAEKLARAQRLPTSRRATLGADAGKSAAATRAEILAKSPGAQRELEQHQAVARGAQVAGTQRLAAQSDQSAHAVAAQKLTNLQVGSAEMIGGVQVKRSAQGYAVYPPGSPTPAKVHKTPSAAAGHARRLSRVFESAPAGVGLLLEGFAAPPAVPANETPAQSQRRAVGQVAAAKASLAAGWNASKHPRAAAGRFGYTTGGKRATRSSSAGSRTLGVGSNGSLVTSIQRQLHIAQDGKYGQQTRAAVTQFQRQHGLQVDGVVGAQTIAALRGHPNARSIRPGPIGSKVARVHPAVRRKRTKPPAPAPVNRYAGGIVV